MGQADRTTAPGSDGLDGVTCLVRLMPVRLVSWAARGRLGWSAGWLVPSLILASPPVSCRTPYVATIAEGLLSDKS